MDNRRARFWVLFLGAAALLALIPEYFFPPEEAALPVSPASRGGEVAVAVVALPPGSVRAPAPATPAAPAAAVPGGGLFSAHSWRMAPAPAPAPAPAWTPPPPAQAAPPPQAPALPFAFIGKMDDSRRLRVFLSRDEKLYTVSVGDVIDGTYRVERIAGSEMVLTYLPLNVRQTLSVGDKL